MLPEDRVGRTVSGVTVDGTVKGHGVPTQQKSWKMQAEELAAIVMADANACGTLRTPDGRTCALGGIMVACGLTPFAGQLTPSPIQFGELLERFPILGQNLAPSGWELVGSVWYITHLNDKYFHKNSHRQEISAYLMACAEQLTEQDNNKVL